MLKQLFNTEELVGKTITKAYKSDAQLTLITESEFMVLTSEEASFGAGLYIFEED